jgi:hypothetical protein
VVAQRSDIDPELRRQILLVTAGVVLLTILVNGATIGRLLAWFGYDRPPLSDQIAQLAARAHVLDDVCESIASVSQSRDLKAVPWGEVQQRLNLRRRELRQRIHRTQQALDEAPESARVTGHWRRVLGLERQAYWRAFAQGTLGGAATQLLSRELDRQLDRLNRGEPEPPATRTPPDAGVGLLAAIGRGMTGFDRLALLYDISRAESLAAAKVLDALPTLSGIDPQTERQISGTYRSYLHQGKERIEDMRTNLPEVAAAIETRLAGRIELNFEREGYQQLAEAGVLDEATAHAELQAVEHRMQQQRRAPTRVPIPETAELVASTPLFSSLDSRALHMLAEITQEKVVPAGEYLFHENEKGASLFVIARGAVHVIVKRDDEERVVNVLGGGDILGEMSLLTGAPRTASARAATSVTVGEVTRDGFSRLMAAQPELRERIWQEFGKRRFDNLCRGLARFSDLDSDQRLAWYHSGQSVTVEPGAAHDADPEHDYVFVMAGMVRLGQVSYPAPSLFSLQAERRIAGVEQARITLLREPAVVLSPRSTRAPLSIIASAVREGD